MRVIGVLDIRGGLVVRGIGGRRAEYRPVSGPLTPTPDPLGVAQAFREHFGLTELYVADLDALEGGVPDLDTVAALARDGFRLWVDAGVCSGRDVAQLAGLDIDRIVLGSETLAGPRELAESVEMVGNRAVFSLDLRAGRPLSGGDWGKAEPWDLANQAIGLGLRQLLVLDLARVGAGDGTGTEGLCGRLAASWPAVEISAGGGVRDVRDLITLRREGVAAVLVASALHDGRLTRDDLEAIQDHDGRSSQTAD